MTIVVAGLKFKNPQKENKRKNYKELRKKRKKEL